MTDKEFLQWLYYRLIEVHDEYEMKDYMIKLKSIIDSTDPNKMTPNVLDEYKCVVRR